jgi:hypothetical protein
MFRLEFVKYDIIKVYNFLKISRKFMKTVVYPSLPLSKIQHCKQTHDLDIINVIGYRIPIDHMQKESETILQYWLVDIIGFGLKQH